jgi:hypothetical protein
VYKVSYSAINTNADPFARQQSIDKLSRWAADWQLDINIAKCCVLNLGGSNYRNTSVYSINGIPLAKMDTVRDLGVLKKAFITYVRPLLEFNSNVLNPHHIKYTDLLESVQRKFSKRIPCLRDLPYPECLARLELKTLELRRLRSDLIMYFKIINNFTALSPADHFTFNSTLESTRSTGPKLQFSIKGSADCHYSFFNRAIKC